MSNYLGFDPTLVDLLRQAMSRALDELDSLRCTDHEADAAMRTIAAARSTVRDTWLPFTSSLLACRALNGYQPATIDPGEVINSWLQSVVADRHWHVLTDPFDAASSVGTPMLEAEQVRALAMALSARTATTPLTAAEISWLGQALPTIARRADLVAAFLPAFTTTGWTSLCNELGAARQRMVTESLLFDGRTTSDESAGWTGIDTVFAGLGDIVVADRSVHPESDATLLLDDMSAYSAALLVRQLDLDAAPLAEVTRELVEREQLALDHTDGGARGPRAADLLFEAMLVTPGAPTAYVVRTSDAPQLAFEASDDLDLARRLVHDGTDPAHLSTADAKVVVPAYVRWILGASTQHSSLVQDTDPGLTMADLIGPYLLPVLRTGAAGFGLTSDERKGAQSLIATDPSGLAMDRLLSDRERLVASLTVSMSADAAATLDRLSDIADLLAFIDTMQRLSVIDVATRQQAEWQLMWTAIGDGAGALPLPGAVSNLPGPAITGLQLALDATGWGPEAVDEVRSRSLTTLSAMTAVAASIVVATRFDDMVRSGRISPTTPIPPAPNPTSTTAATDYVDAFELWISSNHLDNDVVYELDAIKQTIASDHEATADENGALLGT
ncbi:MAG: hypothetical protein JWN62_509 [Acidimicrobiales bacterium]|nr:hypothetical protein [Acidimicrobiales bacterium]